MYLKPNSSSTKETELQFFHHNMDETLIRFPNSRKEKSVIMHFRMKMHELGGN
jgi:hypothetical protein